LITGSVSPHAHTLNLFAFFELGSEFSPDETGPCAKSLNRLFSVGGLAGFFGGTTYASALDLRANNFSDSNLSRLLFDTSSLLVCVYSFISSFILLILANISIFYAKNFNFSAVCLEISFTFSSRF